MNKIESKYLTFKTIQNKISSYDRDSLITECINFLIDNEVVFTEKKPSIFWQVLPILKWSLEFAGKQAKKTANKKSIYKLLELSHALEDKGFELNYESLNRFLRRTSYQQFWFQRLDYIGMFERQYIMFYQLKSRYEIKDSFYNLTGLRIDEFLILSSTIFLSTIVREKDKYINLIDVNLTEFLYKLNDNKTLVDNYIEMLKVSSNNPDKLVDRFNTKIKSREFQTFSPSLFSLTPLLEHNDKIYILHKLLFLYSCKFYLYDYLKLNDDKFSTEFGARMEKYIKLGLDELSINYVDENQLKLLLPKNSKVTDYLIEDKIILESKAIELPPYESVSSKDDLLYSRLKNSLIKAYTEQILTVYNFMLNSNSNQEYYGIVLTYKNLNLGDGNYLWDEIINYNNKASDYARDNNLKLLPKENFFVIDLDTWERLLSIIKQKNISLPSVLEKIKNDKIAAQKDPKLRKFDFGMHLDEYGKYNKMDLNYLSNVTQYVSIEKPNQV
ncbi:MAG: hypothetical protein KAS62_12285 [Candidatus Delongbacteria bacterium]|nr:hypothetical protein [Candidatus Delongbacteria bacterium]